MFGFVGAATSGALTDVGINHKFIKDLETTRTPGSPSIFILARDATPDKVLDELKGTGGQILKTSLSHQDETKLQDALSAARA